MTKKLMQQPIQSGDAIVQVDPIMEPASREDASSVVACRSLESYFYEKLDHARQNQGLEATDETSYYVISLLDSFAKADQLYGLDEDGNRQDEALALILARAMSSGSGDRINHFRRLGDTSLFISGFFSDSLRRRSVNVAYYADMGQGAYASLSSILRKRGSKGGRVFEALYSELAKKFSAWVEVLREVSESARLSTPMSDEDSSDLYARWRRTQGEGPRATQLSNEMLRRGIWPSLG